MPRSSSKSGHFSRNSKSSYSYSSPKSPISSPVSSSIVHHNHQIERPGFFSNMWQGFGLGAGQSIAMNMFRSDPKVTHIHENAPVSNLPKEYIQCMKESDNDKEACKQYLE
jgi:hypothetical protein